MSNDHPNDTTSNRVAPEEASDCELVHKMQNNAIDDAAALAQQTLSSYASTESSMKPSNTRAAAELDWVAM
jgi:hypothetical protein